MNSMMQTISLMDNVNNVAHVSKNADILSLFLFFEQKSRYFFVISSTTYWKYMSFDILYSALFFFGGCIFYLHKRDLFCCFLTWKMDDGRTHSIQQRKRDRHSFISRLACFLSNTEKI